MFVDAAGEQVPHQAGFDTLLFGDQFLRLFNHPIHRRENLGDFRLFEVGFGKLKFNSLQLRFIEGCTFNRLVNALQEVPLLQPLIKVLACEFLGA